MSIDNLQDLRLFNQVVRSQGFTAAAKVLQHPVNMISRRIALLEKNIGTRLLNRTTRKISLTPEGQVLFDRSQSLLEAFDDLKEDIVGADKPLSGTIRIVVRTTTIEFGFVEGLTEELINLEALNVQLIVRDEPIDYVAEGIDLALVINDLPDSSMIQKKLGEVSFALCASPNYIKRKGAIESPNDLDHHHFVSPLNARHQHSLTLREKGKRSSNKYKITPQFQSNNIRARTRAIYSGLGIGRLPIAEIRKGQKEGTLIPILPQYVLPPIPVWSLKTSDRRNDPRLKLIEKLLIDVGKRICA
jgi:LysR family transcriptional regulator for bpeEF and oprC